MSIKDAELLLIELLSQPEGARFDFLISKRKEFGYSEQGFYSVLKGAFESWYQLVQQTNIEQDSKIISGVTPNSLKIPLLNFTDMKFRGHLGFDELELIKNEVEKFNPIPFVNKNEYSLRISNDSNFRNKQFEFLKNQFKTKGYSMKLTDGKIYSPQLAYILLWLIGWENIDRLLKE